MGVGQMTHKDEQKIKDEMRQKQEAKKELAINPKEFKEEPKRGEVGQSSSGTVHSDKSSEATKPEVQIGRAGKPTKEDTEAAPDPSPIKKIQLKTPQERAREQGNRLKADLKKKEDSDLIAKKTNEGGEAAPGIDDSAIPGSRVGDPTEMVAEPFLGDKVHNFLKSGIRLEVQSKDKSNSVPVHEAQRTGNLIKKKKVSFLFPGINPDVAQKELKITVFNHPFNEDKQTSYESIEVFPPDVPNKEVLLPSESKIHVELRHIDKHGHESHPYILDFYTMVITNHPEITRPLQASPIGYELMEDVLTYE